MPLLCRGWRYYAVAGVIMPWLALLCRGWRYSAITIWQRCCDAWPSLLTNVVTTRFALHLFFHHRCTQVVL